MNNTLKEKIEQIAPRWRTREVVKNSEWVTALNSLYPSVPLNIQIDSLVTGRSPYCVVCNSPIKTTGKTTCSTSCRSKIVNYSKRGEKIKATLIEKYGVNNARKIPEAEERRKNTLIEKYGALVSPLTREKSAERAAELNNKGRKTILEKYGVSNVSQIISVKDKKKHTNLVKYGVANISQRHLSPESLSILHNKDLLEDFIKNKSLIQAADELHINLTTLYNKLNLYGIGNIRQCSSYETEIDHWLRQFNIKYIRNSRSIIAPLELDFYFPDHNVAIEFNGLAHHSEFLGSQLRNNKTEFKSYHYQKWKQCADKKIVLLSIFEDEWNNKKEIVKKTIQRLLKLSSNRSIGARHLTIKQIVDKKVINKFLQCNHWQGSLKNFQVSYGAFYNDLLIGVITFSKKEDYFILTRYCVGEGNFPGLFAKFLSEFIKDYDPHKLITFSDNRYATGNIYQENRFVCDKEYSEGYAVTNYINRWHRSNFQKKLIEKKLNVNITGKTEKQLLQENNFDRVWDCGKKRWVWSK